MTAREVLWERAVDRYGYVSVREALDLGIDRLTVDKLAARGQIERVAHGVYRFPQFPVSDYDAYMLAVLWTGTDRACLSHDTALAAYEVSDINPDRIHVTVPKARRVRRRGGELYVVHHQDLAPDQIGWWQQIPTVTLTTAITQCIVTGVPGYLLRQALTAGRDRGAFTPMAAQEMTRQLEERDRG